MVRLAPSLALLPIALAIDATGGAFAQAASRQHVAVVCTSTAGGPWTQKALGTLTRTKSERELVYKFRSADQAFEWRFVTSAQGNTTVSGPGFLMERFGAAPKGAPSQPGQRRQSVEASGEIRESAGSASLVLLVRTDCPGGRAR
jgi:hypothetical protein